ncbi:MULTISPECIES: hypothetical protein [Paraburkholderia]|jgi:hypothetical protein|uniref:Lipoprotein n=1 Tax=Paraburkholderia madseniana TaxID=2599607 RepID=A0A6N6WLC1_9BURK|nr:MULTISPECIES: hypothetical protein [Paraburkholderia]KAE8760634.1 hypothetical protein FSO04_07600 [Paraburkholderia madseniana]MCX4173817.1 hypothetical protein [Paraburkholderia madseniana]MDQ6461821.1 hypothetical protein [Paraburkholderia madseniana]NPT68173.1 hypothetical protein [Paraburkholderia madseniana]
MKIRILSIACVTTAAALLAACTAVYKNSDACEQLMRSKLAETSSPDTLKIAHTGAGIDGSRVVVEGSIEHVMTASEVAAASAASAASAAKLANAPHPTSGVRAASVPQGASSASAAAAASGVMAGAASGAMAASASLAASGGDAASLKSTKPKKINTAAAAECTFHGSALSVFSWLAPAKLATPAPAAASEVAE